MLFCSKLNETEWILVGWASPYFFSKSLHNVTKSMVEPISVIQLEHQIPFHKSYKKTKRTNPSNMTQGTVYYYIVFYNCRINNET